MCQAKIVDHYGGKYKCLQKDKYLYNVSIKYNKGHLEGKSKSFSRILCVKHAHKFRYDLRRKQENGHTVQCLETTINSQTICEKDA